MEITSNDINNIQSSMAKYIDILTMPQETLDSMYRIFGAMADFYMNSTDLQLFDNNKDLTEIILSRDIVDLMKFLIASGKAAEIGSKNVAILEFFKSVSPYYINKLIDKLTSAGYNIRQSVTCDELKYAIANWGIQVVEADNDTDDGLNDLFKSNDDEITADLEKLFSEEDEEGDGEGTGENNENKYNKPINDIDLKDADVQSKQSSESSEDSETRQMLEDYARASASLNDIDYSTLGADDIDSKADKKEKLKDSLAITEATAKRDEEIKKRVEAIEAQREYENKKKEQAELEKALKEELDDENAEIAQKTINSIMEVIDYVYRPLFENRPVGVLTSEGILAVNSDNSLYIKSGKTYPKAIYEVLEETCQGNIRQLDYNKEVSIDCIDDNGELIVNYIPSFHARTAFGVYRGSDGNLHRDTSWKSFRSKLNKMLGNYVTNIIKAFKGTGRAKLILGSRLTELFTTMVIVTEFDMNKSIKLVLKSTSVDNNCKDAFRICGEELKKGECIGLDGSQISLMDNSTTKLGVHNILAILNEKQYSGEMLFAYKPISRIMESGGRVDLANTLLGKDIQGNNVTANFASSQEIVTLVIAGSGSGKGVLTLNLLATFIAEGCPTVYVDWKPDMSAMLWNLERKTGAKILSVDSAAGKDKYGVVPVRNYKVGYNYPSGLGSGINNNIKVLSYMKMFQLMILCAKARTSGGYNGMNTTKKMQFIFDEAQIMNVSLRSLKTELSTYIAENKPKGKDTPSEQYLYAKKLAGYFAHLNTQAMEFRNTTGRQGYIGAVILGQQADCSAWADGSIKKDTFGFLVGNCSSKLLGKGATGGNKYELGGASVTGASLLGNMGYFAYVPEALATKENQSKVKVVKTYLVLNENDFNDDGAGGSTGHCTGGMLNNVTDPVLRDSLINGDFTMVDPNTGERVVNPLVGFPGLIQYIGQNTPGFDLKTNLESGYIEMEKMLSGLGIVGPNGKWGSIEEYVFDYSSNAIFFTSDLETLMQNGGTIADLDNSEGTSASSKNDEGPGFEDLSGNALIEADNKADEKIDNSQHQINRPIIQGSTENTGQQSRLDSRFSKGAPEGSDATPLDSTNTSLLDSRFTRGTQDEPTSTYKDDDDDLDIFGNPIDGSANTEQTGGVTQQSQQYQQQTGPSQQEIEAYMQQKTAERQRIEEEARRAVEQQRQASAQSSQASQTFQNTQDTANTYGNGEGYEVNDGPTIEEMAQPGVVSGNDYQVFKEIVDKDYRTMYIAPDSTTRALKLDKKNSFVARMPSYGTEERFRGSLFKTMWGTDYEFKSRWKAILDSASKAQPANLVSRLVITEDTIAFNKMVMATIGIIGGEYDIRIEDLVDFKMTAKKFKMIKDLVIDETIFGVAQIQLNDPVIGLFNIFPRLNTLTVHSVGCGQKELYVTRRQVNDVVADEKASRKIKEAEERVAFKNQMEVMAAAKNPRLSNKSPGYKSRVWQSTKSMTSNTWKAAQDAILSNEPKLFKGGVNFIAGVAIGVGGTALTLGSGLFRFIANRIRR